MWSTSGCPARKWFPFTHFPINQTSQSFWARSTECSSPAELEKIRSISTIAGSRMLTLSCSMRSARTRRAMFTQFGGLVLVWNCLLMSLQDLIKAFFSPSEVQNEWSTCWNYKKAQGFTTISTKTWRPSSPTNQESFTSITKSAWNSPATAITDSWWTSGRSPPQQFLQVEIPMFPP